VTTITDPSTLKATFWVCIALAVFLFVVARSLTKKEKWEKSDYVRMLVPAGAFILWTILQKSTAWDAISPDSLTEGARALIGAGGAVALGAIATLLGIKLDKAPKK
jgi:hypothetical protein